MAQVPVLFSRLWRGELSIIFYFSIARMVLHLAVNANGGYGLFRDELYYLACASNLDFGYVDHPPLSIYVLKLATVLFGDSLFAVRLVPAVLAGLTTFVIGLIALRLGANRFAQIIACIGSFSLISIAMNSFYSMNSIDFLIWSLVAYIVLRIIQEQQKNDWLLLGLVLGLGLLNKIGVLFLGAGLAAGLLLTKERKWLLTPWPYLTAVIALVIFLPYIVWNVTHDWAHLEFIHNASSGKYSSLSPLDFIVGQWLQNNPVAILIWVPGLYALFIDRELRKYVLLAFLYVIPFIIFVVNGTSKSEYLAPGYGLLWAAGAVWWEKRWMTSRTGKIVAIVMLTLIVMASSFLMPMVAPILPVETYISYSNAIGVKPSSSEGKELSALPQFYADMFGWQDKAHAVSLAFETLSESEKKECCIFSTNYGRCGAIDYYGKKYGLPKAIGVHNNYWIWGTRGCTGKVMIILGGKYEDHFSDFEEVKEITTVYTEYAMPYENNISVFVCRNLKTPLEEVWRDEKNFD